MFYKLIANSILNFSCYFFNNVILITIKILFLQEKILIAIFTMCYYQEIKIRLYEKDKFTV